MIRIYVGWTSIMAGRPKTMVKRVLALLKQAEALAEQFRQTMPAQYRERYDKDDEICHAWCAAWKGTMDASDRLDDLADVLCKKAGSERPVLGADNEASDTSEPPEAVDATDGDPECPDSEHSEPVSASPES